MDRLQKHKKPFVLQIPLPTKLRIEGLPKTNSKKQTLWPKPNSIHFPPSQLKQAVSNNLFQCITKHIKFQNMINQAFVTLAKTVFMRSSLPIKTFFLCVCITNHMHVRICVCACGAAGSLADRWAGSTSLPKSRSLTNVPSYPVLPSRSSSPTPPSSSSR